MKRTSKYLGKIYEGWKVVHVGVATVTAKRHKGKGLNNRPGHCNYYYLLERMTSDGVCEKQVRLTSKQMSDTAKGAFSVEKYSDYLNEKKSNKATKKVNYSFN